MTKEQFDEFMASFYAGYVNIARKHGLEPIEYRLFKYRMKIWEW